MNVADIVIVLILLMGGAMGLKKGFTSQLVDTVGTIAVIVFSFLLKGIISNVLYKFFPFFNFSGKLSGVTSLNLLLYEVLAFFILFVIFSSILRILKATTDIFERILKYTIILGIPSKLLGAVVGMIQNFIFLFVALYFLRLPVFEFTVIAESKLTGKILNSTPVLSDICSNTLDTFESVEELLEKYDSSEDKEKLNQETLQLLVDKKIVDVETANQLIVNGKLKNLQQIEVEKEA